MENYPFLNDAIVNVIKRLRKEAGYSQQKLAEKSSIDRLYVLQLEQKKFRPTLNSIFFIADGLGLTPENLLFQIAKEREKLAREAGTII